MERREALRLLATWSALQLTPRSVVAKLRQGLLATQTGMRTLDRDQGATVVAMAELIIPRTETPGASDVGVSQFIDLILTEWYTEEERNRFLSGLADMDTCTEALFGRKFVDCSPGQQSEVLTALGEQVKEDGDRALAIGRRYRGLPPIPDKNFYYMMRSLTLTAYYTSEEGASKELGFQIIPDRYAACAPALDRKDSR
jgi:hypothetical protein